MLTIQVIAWNLNRYPNMNVNAYIHEISYVLPKISSYNVKAAIATINQVLPNSKKSNNPP